VVVGFLEERSLFLWIAGFVLSEPTDGFGIGVELSLAFHEMDDD